MSILSFCSTGFLYCFVYYNFETSYVRGYLFLQLVSTVSAMKQEFYGLSFFPQVKRQAEAKAKQNFDQFQAISYRKQVVEGMNYLIKVSLFNYVSENVARFAYKAIVVSRTRPQSFRWHDLSRFAYTI